MKVKLFAAVVLLLTVCPIAALAGTYTTDFDEATLPELSPGVVLLGGDATASIGSSQLVLDDATGLGLFQQNRFLILPGAPATAFTSGFDITVVLDGSTIEGMKTCPSAWSGILVFGSPLSNPAPLVVFGPCGQPETTFLSLFAVPAAQWPPGPAMAVCAVNRAGGNRIPWSTPLAATPTDTTLRVVVDNSTPPNATFYVDGTPVLSDYQIGPNQIVATGVVQQAVHYPPGSPAPAITTTVESLQVTGNEVPTYPVAPMASAVSFVSLGILAIVMAALVAIIGTRKRGDAHA